MEIGLLVDVGRGQAARAVTVRCSPATLTGDLLGALRDAGITATPLPRCRVARTGVELDPASTVADCGLRHGDRLLVGAPAIGDVRPAAAAHDLVVVSGLDTARRHPLTDGEHVIGRDPTADVVLRDDDVSRRHLRLDVVDGAVTATDLGSTNGSFVDAQPVSGSVDLAEGQLLEVGNCLLALEAPRHPAAGPGRPVDGRVGVNRPPRIIRPAATARVELPAAPTKPERARLPMAASVVPIAMGLVTFLLLGNPSFLLFMALGPAMALFSVIDSRRSGRSTYKQERQGFEERLDEVAGELASARAASVAERRRAHPPLSELVARLDRPAEGLWERRPGDDDFLVLRLGTADQPTTVDVEVPGGGEDELRSRSEELAERYATDPLVPVVADLPALGVLGVAGDGPTTEAVARGLVLRAALLHSHRDLAIAAFVPAETAHRWAWLDWLPHCERLPGADVRPVAVGDGAGLAAAISSLAAERARQVDRSAGAAQPARPHVLVVIAGPIGLDPAARSQLLAAAPVAGMSVVVVADATADLPNECAAVAEITPRPPLLKLTEAATGAVIEPVVADAADRATAEQAALELASIRDAGAREPGAELPDEVGLTELLGLADLDAESVAARWRGGDRLVATIGIDRAGACRLDLRTDGPHALIAGTTGSGKSELLQTFVASLAAACPPERVVFVLVDYKGGAAFKDCAHLPHTVGFFSDLDAHLAARALRSLNAELRSREEILRSAGARDLAELEAKDPAGAPPSLVIVIDEFAFLRNEVPEFVTGIVDIAQRGRSLGIHLVLATQRPGGVVDENIRANTNLRIALRVNDDHESNDVIGRPDAARIPRTRPGRAFVRTGHSELREVQTGFASKPANAAVAADEPTAPVVVPFPPPPGPVTSSRTPVVDGRSVLQVLVAAAGEAAARTHRPPQRSPWLPPLGARYDLAQLLDGAPEPAGLDAVVGVVDEPDQQRQRRWVLDLDERGHLLVYGATGTGKTTALRTIAASLASRHGPAELVLVGLDFASLGLRPISSLPQCTGVVTGREPEMVERLVAVLEAELAARRDLLGRSGASTLRELRGGSETAPPAIVVLLDDVGAFVDAYHQVDQGELVDRLARLLADGRSAGIHVVATAGRRSGLPNSITAQVSDAVVFRLADDDEYAWLGLGSHMKGLALAPGRGFLLSGTEVQLGCVGTDPSGEGQARALAELGAHLAERWAPVPPLAPVPVDVALDSVRASSDGGVVLGVDALTLAPATVDLGDVPTFLIAGPDRSGRSTALGSLARGVVRTGRMTGCYLVAPRRTPLTEALEWSGVARADDAGALAERVVAELDEGHGLVLVVIDDGDEVADGPAATGLDRMVRRGRDGGLVLLASAQSHVLHRTFAGWLTDARKSKQGLVLGPDVEIDGDLFGVRLPRRAHRTFPPGRGYLVSRGTTRLVQVAR